MTISEAAFVERAGQVLQRYRALQQSLPAPGNIDPAVAQELLQEFALALHELEANAPGTPTAPEGLAQLDQQVAAERARYDDLFESGSDASLVTDSFGVIREASAAAGTLLGTPHKQLIGKPLAVFVGFDDRVRFRTSLNRLRLRTSDTQEMDVTIVSRITGAFPARLWVGRTHGPSSRVEELRWTLRDLSNTAAQDAALRVEVRRRRIAEGLARQTEDRCRSVVEHATDIIYELDSAGRFTYCNGEAVSNILGYPKDQLLGRRLLDIVPGDHRASVQRFMRLFPHLPAAKRYLEFPVMAADGRIVWLGQHTSLVELEHGRFGVQAICRDIAEHRREVARAGEEMREWSLHLQTQIEAERARIARDIHDELGAALTGLRMALVLPASAGTARTRDPARQNAALIELIDTAIGATRRICGDLRPSLLDNMGLCAAIEWLCEETRQRTRIRCVAQMQGLPVEPEPAFGTAMFRIVQEAITNAIRHARASQIKVSQLLRDGAVEISVVDNGCGIDGSALKERRSFGILGMQERAKACGANFSIRGSARGTRVTVRMPLGERRAGDESAPGR